MSATRRQADVAGRSQWTVLLGLGLILAVVALGLAVIVRRSGQAEVAVDPRRANLILITIDTLRADHLGAYGYGRNTSPRMDRFADDGVVFTEAQVQWPRTSPSMASLMTSTYCAVNKVFVLRVLLDDRLTTLAEVLGDAGFRTGAFVANVHIGSYFNFTQGFDDVHEMWDTSPGLVMSNHRATFLSNQQIAGQVVEWLRGNRNQRFFVWVHFLDPHGPYVPPDSLSSRFYGDDTFAMQSRPVPPERVPRYQRVTDYSSFAEFVAAYDAEIVSTDLAVGTILDEIDALGLVDNSLVVITADHGESLGEHQYFFDHGTYAYQACARVPLMMRYPPRVPAGLRIDTPVALLDLVPTVLDLLDVPPGDAEAQFDGRSWAAAFDGGTHPYRPVVTQSEAGQLAVRHRRWKYIFDPRPSTPMIPVVAIEQLYDLGKDPQEAHNVIEEHPQVADRMRGIAAQWVQHVRQQATQYFSPPVLDELLPQEVRERLKSLGYME